MISSPVEAVEGLDLEHLSARVLSVAAGKLDELKRRAAEVWDFREMEPNYAHDAVALLLREALARVVSANWDCAVENASLRMEFRIEGVSDEVDLQRLAVDALPIYKVHGCARRPDTLVLTRAEVDNPRTWAQAKVADAIAGGTVVFVGLGTVGTYVSEPVAELKELWTATAVNVRIVDPYGLSRPWTDALGEQASDVELPVGADEFMDDLMRALVRLARSEAAQLAQTLHDAEKQPWSESGIAGHTLIAAAFEQMTADAVMRWWRDGTSGLHASSFIFGRGKTALLAIAQLAAADGTELQPNGDGGEVTIRSDQRYFEIACRPDEHWSDVERRAQMRVARRRASGRYEPGIPTTVVIAGATGRFPAYGAPADIAGGGDDGVASADADAVAIARAEDALDGKLVA
jgi:hypothetical protein